MDTTATNSEKVTDAELFDMLFGTRQNNPTSPYGSTMSDPGYGYERCWEPGEIMDHELEMQSSSSTSSSSPVRYRYGSHSRRSAVSRT